MKNYPFLKHYPIEKAKILYNFQAKHRFTFQQFKIISDIYTDFLSWQENDLSEIFQSNEIYDKDLRKNRDIIFRKIQELWEDKKSAQKNYTEFSVDLSNNKNRYKIDAISLDDTIMGKCPVASEKTRCCNLLTLDAVRRCGFDCSYCSIQSFYNNGVVEFRSDLAEKLKNLKLDPNEIYHIGTGQSSDSLMWGNHEGLLDSLVEFAKNNPNVILELKSKSANIKYFKKHKAPKNIIFTWSLNPEIIIKNEEHYSDSLDKRLEAAEYISKQGNLVGFHFHPIIYYKDWEKEYKEIVDKILTKFSPEQVCMISLGTLTFTKPVIKKIRDRMFSTKILQMELEEIAGKFSYPMHIKEELFSKVYNFFPKNWHENVYFYMCMEDISLWKKVFNREYSSNDDFEKDMKEKYMAKIPSISK